MMYRVIALSVSALFCFSDQAIAQVVGSPPDRGDWTFFGLNRNERYLLDRQTIESEGDRRDAWVLTFKVKSDYDGFVAERVSIDCYRYTRKTMGRTIFSRDGELVSRDRFQSIYEEMPEDEVFGQSLWRHLCRDQDRSPTIRSRLDAVMSWVTLGA